jgi:FkbM family methyltransferase
MFWTADARHDALVRRLRCELDVQAELAVVQIGANDGRAADPLFELLERHPAWTGVFVEPLPWAFAALKARFADRAGIQLVQCAISEKRERRTIFYVRDDIVEALGPSAPSFHSQLAGFDAGVLASTEHGVPSEFLGQVEVECERLDELLDRVRLERIDVFVVDTEGYDARILEQLDLARFLPRVIVYEHKHLAEAERQRLERRLVQRDYELQRFGQDTLATRR